MKYKHCTILKAITGYNVYSCNDIHNVSSITEAKTLIDSL
jgi:hypothetical protein